MPWLSEFSNFIQQTAKTWLGLFIASGLLLLFPQMVIVGNLAEKADSYFRAAVMIVFILSTSFLASDLIFYVRDLIRERNAKKTKLEALKRLTPPEHELLRRYLKAETKSMGQEPRDPIVILFISRKWLSQPMHIMGGIIGMGTERFLPPHVLADWIYDHLKDNPKLIE